MAAGKQFHVGSRILFAGIAALWMLILLPVQADEVLRTPPALYVEQLQSLLTPAEPVIKQNFKELEEHAAGITLLDERIISVMPDGRRMIVRNLIRKTLTDAGARWNAEEILTFRRKEQRCYLIKAETIQPDGTTIPVKEGAVLVQSPQRQAQYSLYDDQAEVRIIFPNVKPGSITQVILITEDLRARMPGEFTEMLTWPGTWPKGRIRAVVDLPPELAARLRINFVGTGLPRTNKVIQADGRVRYTTEGERIPQRRDEVGRAPDWQIGPCMHYSTVKEWNDVGRWYAGLLKGRDQLSAALAEKVDLWTKPAKEPADILRVLLTKVADDVRYTGLELGEADYQPHECNEVWNNQYGDCKDKANLLVAFLRHKGIPAHLALVNTEFTGLIDRRSPDFRVFNHVIVAIPDGKAGYKFCDPTINHTQVGLLSPGDSDRDVFVITEEAGEWARTPRQRAGGLDFRFDLKLKATGELAGWLTITSDGFYGASYQDWYQKLDPNEARQQLGELLRGYYPGAEVIDVANAVAPAGGEPYVLKLYFTVPRRLESGANKQTLTFPQTGGLFNSIGYAPVRDTPFFLSNGRVAVECVVTLPEGIAPSDLPAAFRADTPAGPLHAAWRSEAGRCLMELQMDTNRSVLPPSEFGTYYGAIQSLRAWLDKPVVLSTAGAVVAAPKEKAILDFPLMSTGAGQLALVEKRFPPNGDIASRRAALEKTLQFFPADKPTVFQASVLLCNLEWDAGNRNEAARRLQTLLAAYQGDVHPNFFAYGQYLCGNYLHTLGRDDEARELFSRVARSATVSEPQRAESALAAVNLLRGTSPAEAISLLSEALSWNTPNRAAVFAALAHLLLGQDNGPALVRQRLEELRVTHPAEADVVLSGVAKDSSNWSLPGDDQRHEALLAVLSELQPPVSSMVREAITQARTQRLDAHAYERIVAKVTQALASGPLAEWYRTGQGEGLRTEDDFGTAIQTENGKSNLDECLRLSLRALVTVPPDRFTAQRLRRAISYADWNARMTGRLLYEDTVRLLVECHQEVPQDDEEAIWGRYFQATQLGRQANYSEEQALYKDLLAGTRLPEQLRPVVAGQFGLSLERTSEYEAALVAYAAFEKLAVPTPEAASGLLRAVFLNLHLEHVAEARRLVRVLGAFDERLRRRAEGSAQISELVALEQTGRAEEFWALREKWWSQWEALARRQGLRPAGTETSTPVIASDNDFGVTLGVALRANDPRGFFQELRRGISAARWLPNMAVNLASLMQYVAQMAPSEIVEFRRLMIAMLRPSAFDFGTPTELGRRQLLLAASLCDNQDPAGALQVLATGRKLPLPADEVRQSTNVIRGLAAIAAQAEREESAAALEVDLTGTLGAASRANTAGTLADLYMALGRSAEALSLMDRESKNPVITADPAAAAALSARDRDLRKRLGNHGLLADLERGSVPAPFGAFPKPALPNFTEKFSLRGEPSNLPATPLPDGPPRVIRQEMPVYPEDVLQRLKGRTVQVRVAFIVDTSGSVISVRAAGAEADPDLVAAALASVAKWRFEPGRRGGRAVTSSVEVPIEFHPPASDKKRK